MKKGIRILVTTKKIQDQNYLTIGDYYYSTAPYGFSEDIYTTEMDNLDYSYLIALHEFIESYLCFHEGISDVEITKFDVEHPELKEPGASRKAPYHKQHMIANKIERMIAKILKVKMRKYNKEIDDKLEKYR